VSAGVIGSSSTFFLSDWINQLTWEALYGCFHRLDVSLAKTAVLSTATAGYCGTPRYRASRSRWSNAWQSGPALSILPGSRSVLCRNGYTGDFARRIYRSCALRRAMPSASCSHAPSKPTKTTRGIAEMMRLGHYRPVHVKSSAAQSMRTTLTARMQLVASQLQIEGTIRGLLKVCGLKIEAIHRNRFAVRVLELLEMATLPELSAAIEPLLRVREGMRTGRKALDRTLAAAARRSAADDHPRRRAGDQPGIHCYSRRPRAASAPRKRSARISAV
jgi:hypothetical protein